MTGLPYYLDELDRLLLDQGDNWMLLTQLDGYLTGILVSPDPVPPNSWVKHIWAGEDGKGMPHFDAMGDFQDLIDLIMRHYNDVVASLAQPGDYELLFDIDTRNDHILWEMWIDGFVQAMSLAPEGWHRTAASDDVGCKAALKGMAKFHAIAKGEVRISRRKEDQWTREAPNLIPIWVEMLHAWRLENDPCPCGSGEKYKKCCGLY